VKHDQGKPQYSLLPLKELEGVVRVLENGAEKYERGDWRLVPEGHLRYLDAGIRHIGDHQAGNIIDEDSGLMAIDHAIISLIFARYHYLKEDSFNGPIA
jgi:hypothetical protein